MKDIIKRYKTPPPLPKRTDSIARNIDKYFNTDLLKSGEAGEEKQDLEVIEHRILGDETEDNLTDDQVEDFEEGLFELYSLIPCTSNVLVQAMSLYKQYPCTCNFLQFALLVFFI